jgi:hypothetical protein
LTIVAHSIAAQAMLLPGLKGWLVFLCTPLLMSFTKKRVGVFPQRQLKERKAVFDSLAELAPVAFEPFSPDSSPRPEACIFLGAGGEIAQRLNLPCYVWQTRPISFVSQPVQVKFSSWPGMHLAIRGQEVAEIGGREIGGLAVEDGDLVAAAIGDAAVWTVRGLVHRVSVEPPVLRDGERLHSHFSPKRWLGLLPLLHFLQSVTHDINWQTPTTRACFLFDDPNLHAWTYGYLDFREMVHQAKSHKYHAAIATVPLDGWYVNPEVARLFREHSDYVSLTTHGCQHTKNELIMRNATRLPLLAQALRRVEKLEARTQLEVSRVMVAPHSACSESTTDLMLSLGYEGASIALKALLKWNQGKRWPLDLGLGTVLWMGAGFPVIYRFEMKRYMQTQLHLTAFLGQPVVFYGHHGDCFAGMENLGKVAAVLEKFGTHWGSLKTIMRSNYRIRPEGALLHVQMSSRLIELQVPEQFTAISIERPWVDEGGAELIACTVEGQECRKWLAGPVTDLIEVVPGSRITLWAPPRAQVDPNRLSGPPMKIWPMVRRALTEARDRLQPVVALGAIQADQADPYDL